MKAKPFKIAATVARARRSRSAVSCTPRCSEGTEYYKHVDEVMADPAAWQGKRLQLHGFVVDDSILQKPNTLDYRFQVQSNGKIVPAATPGSFPIRSRTVRRSC